MKNRKIDLMMPCRNFEPSLLRHKNPAQSLQSFHRTGREKSFF